MQPTSVRGTFDVSLTPAEASGQLSRFQFTKQWHGSLSGASSGEMLSVGDPSTGTASYTALEVFEGELDGRSGGFAFHQYGTMVDGADELRYTIVPASGFGDLEGISGALELDVDADGTHSYTLSYELTAS